MTPEMRRPRGENGRGHEMDMKRIDTLLDDLCQAIHEEAAPALPGTAEESFRNFKEGARRINQMLAEFNRGFEPGDEVWATTPAGRAAIADAIAEAAPLAESLAGLLGDLSAGTAAAKRICSGGEKAVGLVHATGVGVEALRLVAASCRLDEAILRRF